MSIIACVYVPDGIVMAGDSRLTVNKDYGDGRVERYNLSDNTQKVFMLKKVPMGILACGELVLGGKSLNNFFRTFEMDVVLEEDSIEIIAHKLNDYAKQFLIDNSVEFLIAGYSKDLPYVYLLNRGQIILKNYNENNIYYGASWRGETVAPFKLLCGDNPMKVCFELMPLKDAVDMAEFIVELTIKYQRFEDKMATCGGPIDILVITKDEIKFIKHKVFNS